MRMKKISRKAGRPKRFRRKAGLPSGLLAKEKKNRYSKEKGKRAEPICDRPAQAGGRYYNGCCRNVSCAGAAAGYIFHNKMAER